MASSLSTLHSNIGNQFSKGHLLTQAIAEYERAAALAKEAADQPQLVRMQTQIASMQQRLINGDPDGSGSPVTVKTSPVEMLKQGVAARDHWQGEGPSSLGSGSRGGEQ